MDEATPVRKNGFLHWLDKKTSFSSDMDLMLRKKKKSICLSNLIYPTILKELTSKESGKTTRRKNLLHKIQNTGTKSADQVKHNFAFCGRVN